MAYMGRPHPNNCDNNKVFIQVHERVGISSVDRKEVTDAFYGCKKDEKTSCFSDLFMLKRRCIYG